MTETKPKKHSFEDLQRLYTDAESVDQKLFAEMRSNLLLISGEHYSKKNSSFYRRIRESQDISEQQKIRLTKNHVQKIVKTYVNNIISAAPGVGFQPKNENELQDEKAAELHHSIWNDGVERYGVDELTDDWAEDFVGIGEVHTKIFYDPMAGGITAYNQLVVNGQPQVNPDGSLVPDMDSPAEYEGAFVFETVQGFNLLRAPGAKRISDSPYIIVRKMVEKEELLRRFPDKEGVINPSEDKTFLVFDATSGEYRKTNNEVLLKEYYFRPGGQYKNGYVCITTDDGELWSGELPGGIWPIVSQAFDKIQTTPRGRSSVKHMRPYQIEINRASSKIAEHQITLGDDKLVIPNGSKVTSGAAQPGVRVLHTAGGDPTVIAGRDGSQFLNYLNSQIAELYQVMNVAEDMEEVKGQYDAYTMLFRAASQKKKFNRYIKRFERFLISVCKTYLALAKVHLPDSAVIKAVGRPESVNISEFKNSTDLNFEIIVSPQSEDIETKLGKQLAMNHVLQYTANKMEREDIGKFIRNMPYGNMEESFKDMTLDYDSATNVILALDRGEEISVNATDPATYMVKRLVSRMRQADFKLLDPLIQQRYEALKQAYMEIDVQQQIQIQRAKQGYIPTDGYLVTCDLYVPDTKDATKTKRARIPYAALTWLIKQLEAQGQGLQQLESMNQGSVAQMAEMLSSQTGGPTNGLVGPSQMLGDKTMSQGAMDAEAVNPYGYATPG